MRSSKNVFAPAMSFKSRASCGVTALLFALTGACGAQSASTDDEAMILADVSAELASGHAAHAALFEDATSGALGLELTVRDAYGESTASYGADEPLALDLEPALAHALLAAANRQQPDPYAAVLGQIVAPATIEQSHYRLRKDPMGDCFSSFHCARTDLECNDKAWSFCSCVHEDGGSIFDCARILLP